MKDLKSVEFERRFEKFLQSLKFEDKIFLVFDKDVDGVTSGVIAFRAFEKLGIKFAKTIPDFFVEKKFRNLKEFSAGVIVDVPTPMQENFLRKTKNKMLVIDHHPSNDMQSKNVFYVNPRLVEKEIYQPTSYTAFKLFSKFVSMKKEKWIAVIGTVADYAFKDVRDLYTGEVYAKRKEEIWKSKYGKASALLNSAIAVYGASKSFDMLKDCKSLNDFFKNRKIKNAHTKFSKEFWLKDKEFKRTTEFYPEANLIFSIVKTKYSRINSALASRNATLYPDRFVILAEKIDNKYKIHGRMQNGRIHVGEVLKKFGGGGHREAGGCTVDAQNLPKFKKKLIEILKKKQ